MLGPELLLLICTRIVTIAATYAQQRANSKPYRRRRQTNEQCTRGVRFLEMHTRTRAHARTNPSAFRFHAWSKSHA